MSNPEETQTKNKFAEEGKGRSLALLSDSASPVYYGFNCTPRQVRYYKVEKSVEEILKGGYTRTDVEKFLEKVKEKMSNAESKFAEYKTKAKEIETKRESCSDYSVRQVLRKEQNKIETKAYNYEYEVVSLYQRAVQSLTQYLA